MKRAGLLGAVGLSLSMVVACGGDDRTSTLEVPATVAGDDTTGPPRTVNAEGCLTASGDRFVLTDLRPGAAGQNVAERQGQDAGAAPEPTTQSYRLVGMDEELRPLVGQRVQVIGEAVPEQVVDVRESTPPAQTEGQGSVGTTGGEPRVSTLQSTRLEVADLRVSSVNRTGAECTAVQ